MKRAFAIFALCLCAAPAARAAVWEAQGWWGGGCYPHAAFDPFVRDKAYLASDVNGVWTSSDGGRHWTHASRGLTNLIVVCLAPSPAQRGLVYALTAKGLHVSRDGAATWEAAGGAGAELRGVRPDNHRSIAPSRLEAGTVAVAAEDGEVWLSRDAGAAWASLGKPFGRAAVTALGWSPDERSLYAASSLGLARRSGDGPWETLEAAGSPVYDLALDASGVLYAACGPEARVSRDGGATWSSARSPWGNFSRIVPDPHRPSRVFAAVADGWEGEVALSRNGGKTWRRFRGRMEPDLEGNPTRTWAGNHGRMNALVPDPFRRDVLLRTDWWGVWRSDDGARSWFERVEGSANVVGSDVAIGPDGAVYAAAMDNGLLRRRPGERWKALYPWRGYFPDANGHVWRVALRGEHVYGTSSPWAIEPNQFIVSTNGETFRHYRKGLPETKPVTGTIWNKGYPKALALDPSGRIYLGMDGAEGGLFVSDDHGKNWARTEGQPACRDVYNGLAVDPTDARRLYWGAYDDEAGGVYVSEDRARSWPLRWDGLRRVTDVRCAPDGVVYAAGDDGGPVLFASEDRGRTWRPLHRSEGKGAAEALCVPAGPEGSIAYGTVAWHGAPAGRVFWSGDRGASWSDITEDLPLTQGVAAIAYHPTEQALYATLYSGTLYKRKIPGSSPPKEASMS